MTLLHQAAQKAVEQLKRLTDGRGGIAHFARTTEQAGTVRELIAALESALQQQPEPVAKPSRVGEDGWRKLAESQAALLELANLAEDSAAELAAEIGANLPLERAIAGIDYFLTVKEDRRFIEGARADLMKLSEPPALQHQEVPREPVAKDVRVSDFIAGAAWHMANPDESLDALQEAAEWWATEHASPSTTRQQEVGSFDEWVAREWPNATDGERDVAWSAWHAAAPSTPEKAGGVLGTSNDQGENRG